MTHIRSSTCSSPALIRAERGWRERLADALMVPAAHAEDPRDGAADVAPIAGRAEASPERAEADSEAEAASPARQCPCCRGRMIIVETFEGARPARSPAPIRIRIDTS